MTMRLEEDDMNENEEGETRAPSHRADDYKRRRTLRLPATLDQLNMLATELNEDDDDDGNQLPDRQPLFQDSPRVVKQGSSVGPSHHQIVGMLEMSAKNKITTKNAFDLKLIDVLKDAVKNETFSHAGSLLDASAKIYSYRVDKTHQDAYRVLSNLGKEDTIEENEGAEDDGLGGTAAQQKRPKRKHKSTATIESNARAITLTSTDVDYEDDALFRKTVAQFDEGASTGLLMNQTLSAGDGQHILLHCISAPERTDFIAADDPLVDADLKIIGGKGPTQSQSQSSSQDPNDNFSLGDNKTFADLCQRLPEKVSKSSAADLTVPITFVIFLHLCNEHTLELKQEPGETNDFKITQG
uniref:Condensin complex subunit 2 n=1 Tax=Plectus sambesii TaxID=2011161 RepID=A0A914V5L2_9BILA